jgi:hypothetical protein
MRNDATTSRLTVGEVNRRSATTCIDESVQSIRPIEAWLIDEDARRLREHLDRCDEFGSGVYPLLGAFIRAKLADAMIGDPQQVGPDTATGYSLVVYSVDGLASRSQVLSHWPSPIRGGFGLSTCSLLGATLLGMKVGQRSPLLRADGTTGMVELLGIGYRPASLFRQSGSVGHVDRTDAGWEGEIDDRSPETPCTEPKVLPIPNRVRRRQPRHPVGLDDPDGSDPGPFAA